MKFTETETPRGALLLIGDGQWDLASGRIDFNGLARPWVTPPNSNRCCNSLEVNRVVGSEQ